MKKKGQAVLAIDNATKNIGFAFFIGKKYEECWQLRIKGDTDERLIVYYNEVKDMLRKWKPDHVVIEQPFSGRNPRTAGLLNRFLGVLILSILQFGITYSMMTPSQARLGFTGNGHSKKPDVAERAKQLYGVDGVSDDETDAIAIGYAYVNPSPVQPEKKPKRRKKR